MNWSLIKSTCCESSRWLIGLKTDQANKWVAANRHCRWAHTLACCSAPCAVEDSDNVSQCYLCFVFLWQFQHLKVSCFCVRKLVDPLTQPSIKLNIKTSSCRIKMKQNACTVLLGKFFPPQPQPRSGYFDRGNACLLQAIWIFFFFFSKSVQ